ncbi:outer membrane protein assembly factor BamE [Gemmobacter serpentinus]|uniref:outer membrane protein assembly factor BamE n=1 Tax=Gemmobacter serpentinus TaxID=2652247 RepID=UPI00124E15F0|nr:outer membrane protein assembly factor BamE [Gemmobacter serpentinus]
MAEARDVRNGRRVAPWLAAGLLMVTLVACAPTYRNHGYIPSDQEMALVSIGDTREAVAEKIGRPSASGLLNDIGWFYVQSRWKHYGAREPQEIDRQVVAITFSQGGTVSNVERFGLERGQIVPLSRRVTDSNIKGVSFLRQIFSSIGRLRADQLVD